MAGDWIPITLDLSRRREVLLMAEQTGMSRHAIVGMLTEFWGWASGETEDGILRDTSVATIVTAFFTECGYDRFFLSLQKVGWLKEEDGSAVIVNWNRWLSNSAKARLGHAIRQKIYRAKVHQDVATKVATKTSPDGDGDGDGEVLRTSPGLSGDVSSQPVVVSGGACGSGPPSPSPCPGSNGTMQIDWQAARQTANRFSRMGLNSKEQDKVLVLKLAALHELGKIPVDWIDIFIKALTDPKKRTHNPAAYLTGMVQKRAKSAGLDHSQLFKSILIPPELMAQIGSKPRK